MGHSSERILRIALFVLLVESASAFMYSTKKFTFLNFFVNFKKQTKPKIVQMCMRVLVMPGRLIESLKLLGTSQQAREIVRRFATNYFTGRPFNASLLVTEDCQADCDFCMYRRSNVEIERVGHLESYVDVLEPLNLPFLTIVGGEPLMRRDLARIVSEAKNENGIPYVHVVTNGGMLSERIYHQLEDAGLDEIVISLDFASETHSTGRGINNLYSNIASILPRLKGTTQIRLNAILMRDNLIGENKSEDVRGVVEFAERHGVRVSFGAYSPNRNHNDMHMPQSADRERLEQTLAYLLEAKAKSGVVVSTTAYLKKAVDFLKGYGIENCQAGKRFLWILPDGMYMPCNDYPEYAYKTVGEARKFPVAETCTECYAECRGVPEQLASFNIIQVARTGIEFSRMLKKE